MSLGLYPLSLLEDPLESGRRHFVGHFKATHAFIEYNLAAFKVSCVAQNDLAGQIQALSLTHLVQPVRQQLAVWLLCLCFALLL